jgi:signal transduction histidine kinase
LRAVFASVVLLFVSSAAAFASGPELDSVSARRVLILSGAEVMLPAGQVVDGAIRQVLSESGLGPLEFYSEGMDAYRFHTEQFEDELAPFLQQKYRARKPALVFALSDLALDFLIRYRSQLWPDSPVVFTNVDPKYLQSQNRPEWATGIIDVEDFTGTASLARVLQPDARRILVVGGSGDRDVTTNQSAVRSLEAMRPPLPVAVKSGVPIGDFTREFGRLPKDTILLYTMMYRDTEGRAIVPRDASKALAAAASVPVYGVHATYLGLGTLGGAMFDYGFTGRAAAQIGARILRGEAPSSIPVMPGSPRLLAVDARQLKRFGIPERRVPSDYEIRYREPSFWRQYWKRVVAVGIALAAETVLLAALLIERRQRRRAEDENRQRRRELAHAGRLTAVGELTASISHEINQPLGAILANAEAAEMLLESEDGNLDEVRRILSDIRRDDLRASEVVRRVRELSGKREMEMKALDLNAIVESVSQLLEHEARRHAVAIQKDLASDLPAVQADAVSLQQVLINLAMNGIDAMSVTTVIRRRLVIATQAAGGVVEVRVSDTGHGIAEGDRARLFQSFFTTKEHGVGLGLSICRSIVEAHGGKIVGENNAYGGATFRFSLPAFPERRARSRENSPAVPEPAT